LVYTIYTAGKDGKIMAFTEKDYRVFDMFNNRWALVTAGDRETR